MCPATYMTHDMLHMSGGHQVEWLIDGVPIPNTNIATNLGPQIDPKDIDYLEVYSGSYDAEYGDRTYGVFNVVPRTGFERNRECELVFTAGNFYQTNDQINCGGHTQRFAYYASVNGNRSNYGLQTPDPAGVPRCRKRLRRIRLVHLQPRSAKPISAGRLVAPGLLPDPHRSRSQLSRKPVLADSSRSQLRCATPSVSPTAMSRSPGSTPSIQHAAHGFAFLSLQRRRLPGRPKRLSGHLDHRPERELRRRPDQPVQEPSGRMISRSASTGLASINTTTSITSSRTARRTFRHLRSMSTAGSSMNSSTTNSKSLPGSR